MNCAACNLHVECRTPCMSGTGNPNATLSERQAAVKKAVTVEEQVANLLNFLTQHEGQFLLGKNGVACSSLNPLMSDGGIQPPGEYRYFGTFLRNSREDCQAHVDRLCTSQPGNPKGYCVVTTREWAMQTRLHGTDKTLAEVLAARPELSGSQPKPTEPKPKVCPLCHQEIKR